MFLNLFHRASNSSDNLLSRLNNRGVFGNNTNRDVYISGPLLRGKEKYKKLNKNGYKPYGGLPNNRPRYGIQKIRYSNRPPHYAIQNKQNSFKQYKPQGVPSKRPQYQNRGNLYNKQNIGMRLFNFFVLIQRHDMFFKA